MTKAAASPASWSPPSKPVNDAAWPWSSNAAPRPASRPSTKAKNACNWPWPPPMRWAPGTGTSAKTALLPMRISPSCMASIPACRASCPSAPISKACTPRTGRWLPAASSTASPMAPNTPRNTGCCSPTMSCAGCTCAAVATRIATAGPSAFLVRRWTSPNASAPSKPCVRARPSCS
ncbi:hypothetical protein FQZ97_1043300 [compost metagenome]